MSKKISKTNIVVLAKKVKSAVEKNYALPSSVNIDGVSYKYWDMAYIFAKAITNPNKDLTIPDLSKAPSPSGDSFKEQVKKDDYMDQARRVVAFMDKNKHCPNNVKTVKSKKLARPKLFIYSFAKIIVYYNNKKAMPLECAYQTSVFSAQKTSTKVETPMEVLAYFERVFGKINSLDEALAKVENKGYSYYFDDMYSNKESIDRMKKGLGINCTDSCHVFINIVKGLIHRNKKYKSVDCLHVRCSSGTGHVRMKITHLNGSVFYRDPACTISKNNSGAYCNWCTSNFVILAINPSWFTKDLNR